MPATRRLALLLCDEVVPPLKAIHGGLRDMFFQLLTASLARISSDVTFTLDAYDVVNEMAYPPDDVHYDGLLISGSRASAHEDVEWINKLIAYVKRILAEKPSLRVFGICFGHQIIARALGGTCVRNGNHWEVAVTTIQLTPIGKAIFDSDQLDIQQMHRDHVPTVPPSAHLLASTAITPNHGMVIFDPASTASSPDDFSSDAPHISLTSVHVLTIQGHPEFTAPYMSALLDARIALLGSELVQDGHVRESGVPGRDYTDGLASDGVGRVGKVIWGVLGVA